MRSFRNSFTAGRDLNGNNSLRRKSTTWESIPVRSIIVNIILKDSRSRSRIMHSSRCVAMNGSHRYRDCRKYSIIVGSMT
jgi:hypothetical protein